jgi:hypothetical protein
MTSTKRHGLRLVFSIRYIRRPTPKVLQSTALLVSRPVLTAHIIVHDLLKTVQSHIESCKPTIEALASLITTHQFWRYKEMWQNSLRNIIFAILLVEYLSHRRLGTLQDVCDVLGSESTL